MKGIVSKINVMSSMNSIARKLDEKGMFVIIPGDKYLSEDRAVINRSNCDNHAIKHIRDLVLKLHYKLGGEYSKLLMQESNVLKGAAFSL